jgi:hypothetical protein
MLAAHPPASCKVLGNCKLTADPRQLHCDVDGSTTADVPVQLAATATEPQWSLYCHCTAAAAGCRPLSPAGIPTLLAAATELQACTAAAAG